MLDVDVQFGVIPVSVNRLHNLIQLLHYCATAWKHEKGYSLHIN